jgi:diguanylate cyclase (GGDEF)-like protein
MANLEQGAQIETTLSNLQHMDFESDPEAANLRLLEEIKLLRVARHRLRDSQEAAFLAVAAYENRLDKIEKRIYNDPLTKLRNRVGLETTLWQWWQDGRPGKRQMSAALLDLDAFGAVNEAHGSLVGDRILFQLARLIEARIGKADLPARFGGQRFFVLFSDVGPRVAIRNTELLRQSIERITFVHGQQEIRVTASAGISEVGSQDSVDGVFKRLEKMLSEAKKAGRNRSFFATNRDPEAVQSPNLGAEYKEIRI